jgi:hypothetical protein
MLENAATKEGVTISSANQKLMKSSEQSHEYKNQ